MSTPVQGMIRREAEAQIRSLAPGFPAVAVIGPRQSGKTTPVRSVFPQLPYVLPEDPDTRAFAEEDPAVSLRSTKRPERSLMRCRGYRDLERVLSYLA